MVFMKLQDTGLTAEELKAKAKKYMVETYEGCGSSSQSSRNNHADL